MSKNVKHVQMIRSVAIVNDASAVSYCTDISAADYVHVVVWLNATDIALTALKLQEADAIDSATALTSGVDITDLTFASALPSATDDNKGYLFAFPTQGRKKYINIVATVGDGSTGAYVTAHAVLFNLDKHAYNTTDYGVAGIKILPA